MQSAYKVGLLVGSAVLIGNAQADGFSSEQICKAAISAEMYQDVNIMKAVKTGDVPQIQYVRKADGQKFLYRCKLSGDRVVWSAFFNDSGEWGRWRDGEYDAVLTYKAEDRTLSVHSTETGVTKTFDKTEFK